MYDVDNNINLCKNPDGCPINKEFWLKYHSSSTIIIDGEETFAFCLAQGE